MRTNRWFGLIVAAALIMGGCGNDPDHETFRREPPSEKPSPPEDESPRPDPDPEPPLDAEPGFQIGELAWKDCSVDRIFVECAAVELPLDWEDPTGTKIDVFVRKVPASRHPYKGQLWYLQGGPGLGAGTAIPIATRYAQNGWDVYLMDYRGVGMSTSLSCGDDVLDDGCSQDLLEKWGEDLRHFSTTGAARDLGALIRAIRGPSDQVMIFGGSYGSYVANRYLHLFPGEADSVVLLGICTPEGCNMERVRSFNRAVRNLLEACADDEFCSNKVGPDPWTWLNDLMRRLDEGHCYEFYWGRARDAVYSMMATLLYHRTLLPAAVAALHRLDRCEEKDLLSLYHLVNVLWGDPDSGSFHLGHEQPSASWYLFYHITFSEFRYEEMGSEAYHAEIEKLPFNYYDPFVENLSRRWPWPRYETPQEFLTWAPSSVPMLLLNGELDYQTPVWELDGLEAVYDKEGQHYIRLPFTGHSLSHDCEMFVLNSFLSDPTGTLPTGCLEKIRTIPWAGSRLLAQQLMGRDDLWSNESEGEVLSAMMLPEEEAEIEAAIQAARAELRRLEREGVVPPPWPRGAR